MKGSGLIYTVLLCSAVCGFRDEDESGPKEPWDLDGPCQPYIQKFAEAVSKMVRCAASFSSPPKVCTNCVEEYIAMKQIEYDMHHLENVTSLDGTACSRVIYSNYVISYEWELLEAVTRRIWDNSRCSSCIDISWKLKEGQTEYAFEKNTYDFQTKLFEWRHCVVNYTMGEGVETNYSLICDKCLPAFDALFDFYWNIYVTPNVDFCLDVETTMNDSMNLWHNVWLCRDDTIKHREHDITFVVFSFTAFASITVIFYLGSYVQSERTQRNLVQYSRLEAPHGIRSRILSSSALNDELSPSTSTSVIVSSGDDGSTSSVLRR